MSDENDPNEPALKPARPEPDELTGRPAYMPRIPWKWILMFGGMAALIYGGYQVRGRQRADALRAQILDTYDERLGSLSERFGRWLFTDPFPFPVWLNLPVPQLVRQARFNLQQKPGQAGKVLLVQGRRDVQIPRLCLNPIQLGGHRTNEDVPHLVRVQKFQQAWHVRGPIFMFALRHVHPPPCGSSRS